MSKKLNPSVVAASPTDPGTGASAGAGDGAAVRSQSCKKVHNAFSADSGAGAGAAAVGGEELLGFVATVVLAGSSITHKFKNEHHSSEEGGNCSNSRCPTIALCI